MGVKDPVGCSWHLWYIINTSTSSNVVVVLEAAAVFMLAFNILFSYCWHSTSRGTNSFANFDFIRAFRLVCFFLNEDVLNYFILNDVYTGCFFNGVRSSIEPLAFISYSISIIDPSFSSVDEVQSNEVSIIIVSFRRV